MQGWVQYDMDRWKEVYMYMYSMEDGGEKGNVGLQIVLKFQVFFIYLGFRSVVLVIIYRYFYVF